MNNSRSDFLVRGLSLPAKLGVRRARGGLRQDVARGLDRSFRSRGGERGSRPDLRRRRAPVPGTGRKPSVLAADLLGPDMVSVPTQIGERARLPRAETVSLRRPLASLQGSG